MREILKFHLCKTEVLSGVDALRQLPHVIQGVKPLLVTDEYMIRSEAVKQLMGDLEEAGKKSTVFSKITPNPKDYEVMKGAKVYQLAGCDCVIGVGGGSSMDAAKCISAMVRHEGDIMDYGRSTPDRKYFTNGREPLILIPTTSGTGSEMSPHAVITNTTKDRKSDVMETLFYADLVVLDPMITLTMPQKVTQNTGIDALVHMIETYTNKKMLTQYAPFHDAAALEGMKLVVENLLTVYKRGSEAVEARGKMLWAGMIGGFVLDLDAANVHGLAGVLQKHRHTMTHGESVGMLLPACMEFNMPACPARYRKIAEAFGEDVNGLSDIEAARKAVQAVRKLLNDIEFKTMQDFGFTVEEVEEVYQEAVGNSCLKNNPMDMTPEDIKQVFMNALNQRW